MNFKIVGLISVFIAVIALISDVNAKYENVPSNIKTKFSPYIDCVLDRKPCDFIGDQIKKLLPKWFENECANCEFFIKSEAKKIIPVVQKYFPDDWQLIEQRYGVKSTLPNGYSKFFSTADEPSASNQEQKVLVKFSGLRNPMVQDNSEQKVQLSSLETLFSNDQSFGAKVVICLVERKGCDERMKFFKKSMYLFATANECPGCQKLRVFKWFTNVKNFLEKSFPQVLQDIIDKKGE